MEATNTAAAGIGSPLNFPFSTVWIWTLNRASRSAPQIRKKNGARPPPPPPSEAREGPAVDEERRRDAERDEVGQRIVLHPELRSRPGHPGDPAVEAVEHHTHEDGRRGLLDLAGVGRRERGTPRAPSTAPPPRQRPPGGGRTRSAGR